MRLILVLVTLALSSFASAAAQDIYGKWQMPAMSSNGYSFSVVMDIEQNSLTLSNTCSHLGQSMTVQGTVPAVITDTTITTTAPIDVDQKSNGLDCNINGPAATLNYVLIGTSQLQVTAGGDTMTLTRIP